MNYINKQLKRRHHFSIQFDKLLYIFFLLAFPVISSGTPGYYNVREYGAIGDGAILNTKSIQSAIDACSESGGGTVYFPAGRYVSGTLFLKSFVSLHLEPGAVLEGSKNLDDYPVVESKIRSYTDNYTNRSLIYAEGLENISITGQGSINGNGASFRVDYIKDGEPRSKDYFAYYRKRPFIIRMINCRNINVRDITILDSPMWVQHYLACEDMNIDGITVKSKVNFNNDGIDIDGCTRVRISNCNIDSGDDSIVLKSTLDRPCKNIVITNCILRTRCSAFKLGTESNGSFQNIRFSNSVIYNTNMAGIELATVDGGVLNNVSVSGINMDSVGCAIFIRLGNRARPFKEDMVKPGTGSLSNVIISDVQATNVGTTGCSVTGLPSNPVTNISLVNIRIRFKGGGTKDLVTRQIEEFPEKFPAFYMFGVLPAYGFFCSHAEMLQMQNIDLAYDSPDYRPALYLKDVKNSIMDPL